MRRYTSTLSSAPVVKANRVLSQDTSMRTAPEASAASTNAIVSGSTNWSAEVNPNDCAASRTIRYLNAMSGAASTARNGSTAPRLTISANTLTSISAQQQHELPLAALAQVMPQAHQQRAE